MTTAVLTFLKFVSGFFILIKLFQELDAWLWKQVEKAVFGPGRTA